MLRKPEHRMDTEGSRKAEVGGDLERKEVMLKGMDHWEDNQLIITNLIYSKQCRWLASADNLTF